MTMHKLIVVAMLIVSMVAALFYVSTFPAEGAGVEDAPPTLMLESEQPSTGPAGGMAVPVQQRLDTQTLRHLA
ncbi:hypothetical protein ACG02S_16015 [Roseateles sp. DC23W]|uniref:Uncharacterized protein n=1 Tax=Pelomonas dachongensis TaxID=3299029 RepID=A0ABW7ERA8_9BURK